MPTRTPPDPDPDNDKRCEQDDRDGVVIDQSLFEGALRRERRRSERSNDPLLLLTVTASDTGRLDPRTWENVARAVAEATRDTDVLGWLHTGATLGVILTEIRVGDQSKSAGIEGRILSAIEKRAGRAVSIKVSTRLDAWPEQVCEGVRQDSDRPVTYDIAKRGVDIAGSMALLVVLSPLLTLVGVLIKLRTAGPVLFKQTRVGYRQAPFTLLKFRTMRVNADYAIHQEFVNGLIAGATEADRPATYGVFKIVDDPRVTRIGKFLRRTSVDELPQLWNVLRGDMSLVGPRPPLAYEVDRYSTWHRRRLFEAKPGLTGLWQVTGRSRTTFDEMVRLDLRYAGRRSLWADLKILLATPRAVITGKGAH